MLVTNKTFELDFWPTDLKINRDHLLIKDYLPTNFEASGAKPSWVISCTRLRETDIPTDGRMDRLTCATQYAPPFSKGGIIKIPNMKYFVTFHTTDHAFHIFLFRTELCHLITLRRYENSRLNIIITLFCQCYWCHHTWSLMNIRFCCFRPSQIVCFRTIRLYWFWPLRFA